LRRIEGLKFLFFIIVLNPGGLPNNLKMDDLYKEHESIPRNPLLATAIYYTGMIDAWGRGTKNIVEMFDAEGLAKPIFQESGGYFRVIFQRPEINAPENATENAPEKILTELKKNNKISYDELSSFLNVNRTTIMRNISKLKKDGKIKRIGPAKGGHWQVL
jgi:ATP-dependent DNA helicase RecG